MYSMAVQITSNECVYKSAYSSHCFLRGVGQKATYTSEIQCMWTTFVYDQIVKMVDLKIPSAKHIYFRLILSCIDNFLKKVV